MSLSKNIGSKCHFVNLDDEMQAEGMRLVAVTHCFLQSMKEFCKQIPI
jgi:hypothetical protein